MGVWIGIFNMRSKEMAKHSEGVTENTFHHIFFGKYMLCGDALKL